MSPEKTTLEQELNALFIENSGDSKWGLQSAIKYVAKEKLTLARSIGEIFNLKSQVSEIMEASKEAEQNIFKEITTGNETGRVDFIFDFTKKDHKTAFLRLYESVSQLIKLRYLHSNETGEGLLTMLEKWYSWDMLIQIKIEVFVQDATHKRIQNIRIFQVTPPEKEKKSVTNINSNFA